MNMLDKFRWSLRWYVQEALRYWKIRCLIALGLFNEERARRELKRMEKAKAENDARFWWRTQ
jgi:hypothetical protein